MSFNCYWWDSPMASLQQGLVFLHVASSSNILWAWKKTKPSLEPCCSTWFALSKFCWSSYQLLKQCSFPMITRWLSWPSKSIVSIHIYKMIPFLLASLWLSFGTTLLPFYYCTIVAHRLIELHMSYKSSLSVPCH
jgi:hypothetical protein